MANVVVSFRRELGIREDQAKNMTLSWPQLFLVVLIGYVWLIVFQIPIGRGLSAIVKLPAQIWLVAHCMCLYYSSKAMRAIVLTWHMDFNQNPPVITSAPTQVPTSPSPLQAAT